MRDLLDVVKNLFLESNISVSKDSLLHLIDINNFPSLEIITNTDSSIIKKEQILDLQYKFSKTSVYSDLKIYIIDGAEKMNKESANTLLKFLEEPNDNIVGFLVTNNKDSILPTIQSRCQLINNYYEKDNLLENNTYGDIVSIYLYKIEVEKKELILYNKKCLGELDKNEIIDVFNIIFNIYNNILNNEKIPTEYNFLLNNNKKSLKKKIKLIIKVLEELNYNVNVDMLLDRFIIEMDGINNESI